MLCVCHGEPAYWENRPDRPAGGYWRCAVKKRADARRIDLRRADTKAQRQRERYDNDPVYRIEKNLHDHARRRRQTIERRRASLVTD